MKSYKFLLPVVLVCLLSCNKDDSTSQPAFVGNYEVFSLRDECSNPANEATVNADADGVCLQSNQGVSCIDLKLAIRADATFELRTQVTNRSGGITFTETPSFESGNYTTDGYSVTLLSEDGDRIEMILGQDGSYLDWLVAMTQAGCDRIYRLLKQ